jgi:hypothetical protein
VGKDDLLPKKKASSSAVKTSPKPSSSGKTSGGASSSMRRVMRVTRGVGVFLGGLVTLVGLMSLVGIVTDNFWVRFLVALLVVVGLPAFVSDRFLKRTNLGGGLAMVADIFAIVLLGIAIALVSADFASKPLFVREGDRYARSGSRTMARVAYFLGGVSPTFPDEKSAAPTGSGSASAAPSAKASGSVRP